MMPPVRANHAVSRNSTPITSEGRAALKVVEFCFSSSCSICTRVATKVLNSFLKSCSTSGMVLPVAVWTSLIINGSPYLESCAEDESCTGEGGNQLERMLVSQLGGLPAPFEDLLTRFLADDFPLFLGGGVELGSLFFDNIS